MSNKRNPGTLKFNKESERWRIHYPNGEWDELTSGAPVELKIAGHWIHSTVEHNGKEYYSTRPGTKLQEGLLACRIMIELNRERTLDGRRTKVFW